MGSMSVKKATLTGITTDSGASLDFITNDNTLVFNGTDQDSGASTLGIWISGGIYGSGNGSKGTLIGTVSLAQGQKSWTFSFAGTPLADGTYTVTLTDGSANGTSALNTQIITIDTKPPIITSI